MRGGPPPTSSWFRSPQRAHHSEPPTQALRTKHRTQKLKNKKLVPRRMLTHAKTMKQPVATQPRTKITHASKDSAPNTPDRTPHQKNAPVSPATTRNSPSHLRALATTPNSVSKFARPPTCLALPPIFRWLREHPDFTKSMPRPSNCRPNS